MDPEMLAMTIRELGIRTVLNLRGPNPGDGWYDRERATTLSTGAVQIDMPLSRSTVFMGLNVPVWPRP